MLKYDKGQEYEGHYDYFFHKVTRWIDGGNLVLEVAVGGGACPPMATPAGPLPTLPPALEDCPAVLHRAVQEGIANGGNRYLTVSLIDGALPTAAWARHLQLLSCCRRTAARRHFEASCLLCIILPLARS